MSDFSEQYGEVGYYIGSKGKQKIEKMDKNYRLNAANKFRRYLLQGVQPFVRDEEAVLAKIAELEAGIDLEVKNA